jgi:signal transduction histidine kinase
MAADDVRPFVAIRRQALELKVPAELGEAQLDEQKMRDTINHLLLNAVKFTPDGGTVTMSARRNNGTV